jgi:uridylate kinase
VDGIYSADPKRDQNAQLYERLSYRDVLLQDLGVMDQTAITLCAENRVPLIVLNIQHPGAVASAIRGDRVGTIVQ